MMCWLWALALPDIGVGRGRLMLLMLAFGDYRTWTKRLHLALFAGQDNQYPLKQK